MKVGPVAAQFFHADGQMDRQADRKTDMTRLIGNFRNFDNVLNKNHFSAKNLGGSGGRRKYRCHFIVK